MYHRKNDYKPPFGKIFLELFPSILQAKSKRREMGADDVPTCCSFMEQILFVQTDIHDLGPPVHSNFQEIHGQCKLGNL